MGGAERIGNFGATEIDASNTAAQADAPLTRAEAVKLVQSYVAAYNNRDLDAMLALQDENVVSCPARLFGGIYLIAWFDRVVWSRALGRWRLSPTKLCLCQRPGGSDVRTAGERPVRRA